MGAETIPASPWMMLPFGLLLGAIGVMPLCCPNWWARRYPIVAYGLGSVAIAYYVLGLHAWAPVLHMAHVYVSFIVLIGALFVVSGGIHISVKTEANPRVNVLWLLIGALLSNVLGTTGASMLLIRPWLRMNKERLAGHHLVFFIFIVSNAGGCLTPVGDPPLFLGYLKGVPFWWVARYCWPMWALGVGFLLAVFYVIDSLSYQRAPKEGRPRLAGAGKPFRFDGLWNIVYLAVILGAVFINHPALLREGLMGAAAAGSYFTTQRRVHVANDFDFHPLREVAVLFAGIFATMIPTLDWLHNHAGTLTSASPSLFYWGSGLLSSFLDSAPAYLGFLSAAFGRFVDPEIVTRMQHLILEPGLGHAVITGARAEQIQQTLAVLQQYSAGGLVAGKVSAEQIEVAYLLGNGLSQYLLAISVATVFFGACTYLGNGPNFMVKSIADHQKLRTPGFVAFIFQYALPCMAPLLVLVWWLFFRIVHH